jgi:transposase-like protein
MLSGCIMCSASACAMLSCFWLSEALSSPMRRCGAGAGSSAKALPPACAAAGRGPGTWYLDEVFIRIQGVQHYLWRAVDQDGVVLDILVQDRRDAKAVKRFFRRLLAGLRYVPRVIVTDKLRSYGVAQRRLLPGVEHRQSRYLNNRAENSHRPTRRRERQMQRFKSPHQAQHFLTAHAFIHGHFHPRRYLVPANASCDQSRGI